MGGRRESKKSPAPSPRALEILTEVGVELRSARLAAGLTQREVAVASGYSHQLVEKVENGQRNPTVHALEALAAAARATLEITITSSSPRPRALPPPDRLAIASRLLAVLPRLPDARADSLLHQIALWETEYPPNP